MRTSSCKHEQLESSCKVSHHPTNGITFVSGGKWTTWREMAEDGVDQVLERHPDLKKKAHHPMMKIDERQHLIRRPCQLLQGRPFHHLGDAAAGNREDKRVSRRRGCRNHVLVSR